MAQPRERDLVRRAQAGDGEAFAALVAEHQPFVYNLALRALGSPQEAEDVAQEALIRVWLALPGFRGQANLRTWIYRIVTNLCYKRLPSLRRELDALGTDNVASLPDELSTHPAADFEDRERRRFLHRQIDALPASYRVLIILRYQQELSCKEIGNVLGLSVGAVKTGLHRARVRLAKALREFEGDSHERIR